MAIVVPKHDGPPPEYTPTRLTKTQARTTWERAFDETYPAECAVCTKWSARDWGCAKSLMAAFEGRPKEFHDFLAWAVRDWRRIISDHFRWMTRSRPPRLPTVTFLSHFRDQFLDAWAMRREYEWWAEPGISPRERQARALMKDGGMDPEAARATAAGAEEQHAQSTQGRKPRRRSRPAWGEGPPRPWRKR